MRGMDEMQETLFTTVKLEDFVPTDHPLRPIRLLVNDALKRLNGAVQRDLCGHRPGLDCPREAAACAAVAGVLLGARRPAASEFPFGALRGRSRRFTNIVSGAMHSARQSPS
jgi:hypothetical protein